jgi:hypothetical protein
VIKVLELSAETVAFLFQVFEYRCEICHPGILAGHLSFDYDRSAEYYMLRSLIWIEGDGDEKLPGLLELVLGGILTPGAISKK